MSPNHLHQNHSGALQSRHDYPLDPEQPLNTAVIRFPLSTQFDPLSSSGTQGLSFVCTFKDDSVALGLSTGNMAVEIPDSVSVLSIPELSSPSISVSSNEEGSFFSARSSDSFATSSSPGNSANLKPLVLASESRAPSPILLKFPAMATSVLSSAKNAALSQGSKQSTGKVYRRPEPLAIDEPFDLPPPPVLSPLRGRKLHKSRPSLPSTSETSSIASLSNSSNMSCASNRPLSRIPFGSSGLLFRRQTTHAPETRLRKKLHRQNSLPSIPSATLFPIKTDNLDLESNGRLVKFRSPDGSEKPRPSTFKSQLSPYPTRSTRDRNTEALSSLAWTGSLPSACPSGYALSDTDAAFFLPAMKSSGLRSTWSLSEQDGVGGTSSGLGDELVSSLISPRSALTKPQPRGRRWTLAMVIADDDISDEMLVAKLESMRVRGKGSGWRRNMDSWSPILSPSSTTEPSESPVANEEEDSSGANIQRAFTFPPSRRNSTSTWQSARRALLICREFVRTERHYLSSLRMLLSHDTLTPPPALMLTYVPTLAQASEKLLTSMEANPSAQGIADAFLSVEDQLETAFVSWCGVVGGFFIEPQETVKRGRASSIDLGKPSSETSIMRRMGSLSKRINSIKRSSNDARDSDADRPNLVRRPSVRDLAILPTQRVMRYTLLFKDLLLYTPSTSPSQKKVELALQAALSLAQRCDKAQDNASFLLDGRP